jgi:hypothetical protein
MRFKHAAILAALTTVAVVAYTLFPSGEIPTVTETEQAMTFGAAPTALRQEINIINAYMYAGSATYATSSAIVQVSSSTYSGATAYFEIVASTTAGTIASVTLVNATSSASTTSMWITGGNTYTRYRSPAFMMPDTATEYKVRLNNEATGKGIVAARIVILQSGTITNTQTQIEIGSATTSANNTASLPLKETKYWYYDSAVWDASPTFYAEVTYRTNPVASTTQFDVSATTTDRIQNWVASAGVGYATVEAWGPGGGGDGVTSAATIGGGGGGGGAYARATTSLSAGSTYVIGIGRGGAEGTLTTASTSFSLAGTKLVGAAGGAGSNSANGAPGGQTTSADTIGTVEFAGGKGGGGETTADTGGGGGGSAGPNGAGGNAATTTANVATAGGQGNNGTGGAGGAAGSGAGCPAGVGAGKAGVNNNLGAGGGGGADGDNAANTCIGGNGGRPGGGGGGSDEGANTSHLGGPGRLILTEYIGTVGVALEVDNGSFGGWTFVAQIVAVGNISTTSQRVRVSFTPTTGKNYRLVASTTNSTASYDIYNAKIVVDQSGGSLTIASLTTGQSNAINLGDTFHGSGQSFVGDGRTLASTTFWIQKDGSPTGNAVSKIYASTGSNGTTAKPTGAALATSDNVDVTTISGASTNPVSFQFSGGNQITLTNGTVYIAVIEYTGGDVTNNLVIAVDSSSPPDTGNGSYANTSFSWTADSGIDFLYRVNATAALSPTLLEPQYLLANTTFSSGTGAQPFPTSWNSAEWAGSDNAYYYEASAADNSTSVVTLNDSGGTVVTNSTVTSPDNRGRSSAMCMPSNGDLHPRASTNNGDIFSSRIIVQVGGTPASCGPTPVSLPQSTYFFD